MGTKSNNKTPSTGVSIEIHRDDKLSPIADKAIRDHVATYAKSNMVEMQSQYKRYNNFWLINAVTGLLLFSLASWVFYFVVSFFYEAADVTIYNIISFLGCVFGLFLMHRVRENQIQSRQIMKEKLNFLKDIYLGR